MNKKLNLHKFSSIHLLTNKEDNFYFIKDPVHGEINFDNSQLWIYEIINSFEFQRLSKIKQLGLTFFNFPSATHNRLCHSLGAYEVCNKFITHFLNRGFLTKDNQIEINIAYAAALLHDIGHGPHSHLFEKAFNINHESFSAKIINAEEGKINKLLRKKAIEDNLPETFYIDEIIKIIKKESQYKWIQDLITSDIDVDRLDYIARDQYFSGVSHGEMDIDLLIKWSVLVEKDHTKRLLFLDKARFMIFNWLTTRSHMYLELYHNSPSLVYENLYLVFCKELKKRLPQLAKEYPFFNLYLFLSKDPESWTINEYLFLNDETCSFLMERICRLDCGALSSVANMFLGFEGDSQHRWIKLEESQSQKLQQFCKEKGDESSVLFADMIKGHYSNLNVELSFLNSSNIQEQQLIETIPFTLQQDKCKTFYLAIISENFYLDWIK